MGLSWNGTSWSSLSTKNGLGKHVEYGNTERAQSNTLIAKTRGYNDRGIITRGIARKEVLIIMSLVLVTIRF